MITQEQFLDRLAKMRPNVYLNGELIDRTHEKVIAASSAMRLTFSLVDNPEFTDLLTAKSHITGKTINRFTHIHQSIDDLLKKQEMTRKICQYAGGCIQRCMGVDMMNALSVTTKDIDLKYGTNYNENFLRYLEYFQENDIVAAGGQTDTKGDRKKRPSEQWDPDQYLHVVERRPDGVVVRGCKVHNSHAPYCDEIIVTPTRALRENEKDWAIAFAVPADTEGVYLICRESSSFERDANLNAPFTNMQDLESMTVFDDVFVPNERIFLNGETEFAGQLALGFALYHRHSYTGCKPASGDILMGLAALLAEYNGIRKESHVKSKLADYVSVAELIYAAGIASSVKAHETASGTWMPDVIYANVGRRHAGHNIFHEFDMLCDIAGGLSSTLPLSKEYNSPEVGKYVKKYIRRKEGVPEENIWRAFALANDLLCGDYSAVSYQVAGMHGGGSPAMEDVAIMGNYDIDSKVALAKHLAGIED